MKKLIFKLTSTPRLSHILGKGSNIFIQNNYVRSFLYSDIGANYGLSFHDKVEIIKRFKRTVNNVTSGTSWLFHILMAKEILSIPKEIDGDLIECGCWKGASSVNLSIVAKIAGRKLWVCDSFEGLPDEGEILHTAPHFHMKGKYHKGDFLGAFDEVKSNVSNYGEIDSCVFIKGFFEHSLKTIPNNKYVFAFLDVDLVSSTKDCLLHIWPRLQENCQIYSDDAGDLEVVKIYFDDEWWSKNLDGKSPGFIGSGCGLPVSVSGSPHGYCLKKQTFDEYKVPANLHE